MNKLYLFVRIVCPVNNKLLKPTSCVKDHCFEKGSKSSPPISSSSSDSSSDSDTNTKKAKVTQPIAKVTQAKAKNEQAVNKLNALLNTLIEKDNVISEAKLDLAKPTNKRNKGKPEADEIVKKESIEMTIVKSVKDVAKEIGGEVKQTESELLSKLLNPVEAPIATTKNLSDIVKGMQIDREIKPVERSRADQVRNLLQQVKGRSQPKGELQVERRLKRHIQQRKPERVVEKISLFGSEPLGIFTNTAQLQDSRENGFWETLYERDLKLAVTHPPANYFQQMILWTEQGKLWKFPIDNEQGLDEEKKVYFTKHVFLEEHLEPWCPPKGPIRHFMELVCVGLSKNPYVSVDTKIEHIEWYKNYFEDKKKILQETGAIPAAHSNAKQKAIE